MPFLNLSAKIFAAGVVLFAAVISTAAQNSSAATPQAPDKDPSAWSAKLAAQHEQIVDERIRVHVFRLRPGDDLLESLRAYAHAQHLHAAVVLTAAGSLTQAAIRYANQPNATLSTGHFEIVSLVGTLEDGGEHLHLSLGAENGTMIGGHLMPGCRIYTTGEIVLGELPDVRFARELDKQGSGWEELKIFSAAPFK
jgi:uncharacterized protein